MRAKIQKEWFSLKQCNENPKNLYVFGDNMIRKGKGGQAQIRTASNSFGIATKRLPSMKEESFFNDRLDELEIIENDLEALCIVADDYNRVIFPENGLGTGLSEMPERSPHLFNHLNLLIRNLFGVKFHF